MQMKTLFGKRMKELRLEKGLTQKQLAEELQITVSTVSRYERGLSERSTKLLIKCAEYFQVSTDYLFGRTDVRKSKK